MGRQDPGPADVVVVEDGQPHTGLFVQIIQLAWFDVVHDKARRRGFEARAEGAELSHEATVGKVGAEQLSYLMSRGLTEEEATSLIIRGFVKLKVPGLPDALQSSIDAAIKMSLEGGM